MGTGAKKFRNHLSTPGVKDKTQSYTSFKNPNTLLTGCIGLTFSMGEHLSLFHVGHFPVAFLASPMFLYALNEVDSSP